jgi:hypothetical protein
MEDMRNIFKILVGKSEEKRPFGRPTRRWEYNITIPVGTRGSFPGGKVAGA